MNFLSEEEETTATLERVENIRKLINNLIDAKKYYFLYIGQKI